MAAAAAADTIRMSPADGTIDPQSYHVYILFVCCCLGFPLVDARIHYKLAKKKKKKGLLGLGKTQDNQIGLLHSQWKFSSTKCRKVGLEAVACHHYRTGK